MDTTDSTSSTTLTPCVSAQQQPSPLATVSIPSQPLQLQAPTTTTNIPSSPVSSIGRSARMSLERRASNPGEGPGTSTVASAPTTPTSAAVLMMRRRVSSNSSWNSDNPNSPTNNNNNNSMVNVNYNCVTVGPSGFRVHQAQGHMPTATATSIRKEREQQRLCPKNSVSTIVDDALMQMNLKRSSSAPMINQLGIQKEPGERFCHNPGTSSSSGTTGPTSSNPSNDNSANNREMSMDIDVASFTSSFLASLNNPRPRRFSASFSPGSPGPAPSRVSQLRHENAADWEALGEKEFLGTVNMAQSWEDLSLDPMEIGPSRRPSFSDQLWLSMPPGGSSASSSPAVSPRVLSRFSPSLSSPSPTRKSFTTRRSLSPIAVRPSVLSVGHGVKRKCDWESSSSSSNNQMDTSSSPQPAPKRIGGLLSLSHNSHRSSNNSSPTSSGPLHFGISSPHHPFQHLLRHRESPNSLETGTESSVSSISGGGDSPFFRPVDSPMNSPSDSSDSPCRKA